MINFDTYRTLYGEAKTYDDIEMYIMERGWQDWMDDMDADQIADLLRRIYTISRDGIGGMLETEGIKLTVLCRRYCIPYDSAQKWRSGERHAPDYLMLLLGWAIISG